jgi:hypothetical protein
MMAPSQRSGVSRVVGGVGAQIDASETFEHLASLGRLPSCGRGATIS